MCMRGASSDLPPNIAVLPKADLHLHQERLARVRQLASVRGQQPHDDWGEWRTTVQRLPPGLPRLEALWQVGSSHDRRDDATGRLARFQLALAEAARAGAVLAELRVGNELLLWPHLLATFREAELQVHADHPSFHAELVGTIKMWANEVELDSVVSACGKLAREGLGGIDLLYQPYTEEASWSTMYRTAGRLAEAGLGVTAHAGEFSTANVAAALGTPGITRIGHGLHAAMDSALIDLIGSSGITVECCLTSNVVLGAVTSYERHPIRRFLDHGIPVVLGTDNPLQMGTSIDREYAIAHRLGLSPAELWDVTARAIDVSFATASRKEAMRSIIGTRPADEGPT